MKKDQLTQEIADYKLVKQITEYQYVECISWLVSDAVYIAQIEGVNFSQD